MKDSDQNDPRTTYSEKRFCLYASPILAIEVTRGFTTLTTTLAKGINSGNSKSENNA